MSTGNHIPAYIEDFHGMLMKAFHDYRNTQVKDLNNQIQVIMDGGDFNNIIALTKKELYKKRPKAEKAGLLLDELEQPETIEKDIPLPSTDYLRAQSDFCRERIGIDDFMKSIAYDLKRAANEIDRLKAENERLYGELTQMASYRNSEYQENKKQAERIEELNHRIYELNLENNHLKNELLKRGVVGYRGNS